MTPPSATRAPSISRQLIVVIVTLVTVTTLTAGVPAYLIVRSQLEEQAWSQVHAAREATRALYRAESNTLRDLTTLLAERPTLLRILTEGAADELPGYLNAFRDQSKLDFMFICDDEQKLGGGAVATEPCPLLSSPAAMLWEGRPALMATAQVRDAHNKYLGSVAAGIWLDDEFIGDLAAQTVATQSLLDSAGKQLVSNDSSMQDRQAALRDLTTLDREGQTSGEFSTEKSEPHIADYFTLPSPPGGAPLIAEIALPIDSLHATEQRALAILVASTFAVAILGALLGAWLVHRLTSPLAELTATAERISQGDFLTQVPVHATSAEVATLSAALAQSQIAMLEALDENELARDWLFNLIQSIDEGVITYAPSGVITFMGRSAETISGWPAPESVGRPLDDVLPITEPPGATWLDQAPAAGSRRQVETTDRSGRPLILDVSGAQMSPPGMEDIQMALVLRDITEESVQRRLRSYFLDSITHEFRTPLSTLSASLELLLDTEVDLSAGEMRELLKPTHMSLLTLQQLVDNVLTSSRIEAGRFSLHMRPTDLGAVITGAIQLVKPMLERRQQTLTVAEPALPLMIQADPGPLTQALVNLLTNASKYSPIGAPIDVMVSPRPGWMHLAVADRGPGIPPSDRARLFERFVRMTGDDEQYGIGLGLAIVKSVVEAHHGWLGVDERPGGGAIFWFDLPLAEKITDEQPPAPDQGSGSQ